MNLPTSQLDEVDRDRAPRSARAAAMKFTYPSGSRPLDGYTIKRGVGRGGFGEVYFATSDAGKEVALKLICRNLDVELRGVTQCLNLKHPNLIGLFDIRSDGMDDQWVIMEFVSGESLEDIIDRHPNGMPIEQVLFWMRGLCSGVAYLHDHGIVHRDLKPGNVFLDEGTVKIGDYGLAKFISCSRRSGQTESVGTVHYMAPEIANGRYGREIDTYALSIILYEMLTGSVPFEGESVGEVLMKHLTAEPDLERLDEPCRDIVRRGLAKDPDARIKSVGEMLKLLPGGGDVTGGTASAAVGLPNTAGWLGSSDSEPPVVGSSGKPAGGSAEPRPQPPFTSAKAASPSPQLNAAAAAEVEEPIWKAIRDGFTNLKQRWHGDGVEQMHPLSKALIVFALIVGVIFFGVGLIGPLFALAIPTAICYGIYYVIWVNFLRPGSSHQGSSGEAASAAGLTKKSPRENVTVHWPQSTDAQSKSAAARYADHVRRRRLRPSWRERADLELAAKPLREKFSELMGSMLMAAIMAAMAALIAPVVLANGATSPGLATYLWLALVGTLGSWAILVPTKFAEGRVEDQVPLRLVLLVLGALIGLAAWGLADMLILQIPSVGEPIGTRHNWGLISHEMLGWSRLGNGVNPPLVAYVAYFAFLFLLLRWWRQAEYTRSARLSLWSLFVCVFWAWLLQFFWNFPQPAGMLVAGVVAFATQMASPWLPPSRRRALSEEVES